MKTSMISALLFCFACSSTSPDTTESTVEEAPPEPAVHLDTELRQELMAMLELDQKIRQIDHQEGTHEIVIIGSTDELGNVIAGGHENHQTGHAHGEDGGSHSQEHPLHTVHGDEMHTVDANNTARLKEIIAEHGWPGVSLVERDGARAAFLLAQHADMQPAFQRRCLELMENAAPGEVSPGDIAYLTDRVRVNSGQPQLYGTQFWIEGGSLVPRPIEEPGLLDARREAAGLIPMSEYSAHMKQHDH